ncbi:hypothetical protein ACFFK9_09275 [Gluconobacter kanchanaburiensis]
MCNRQTNGRVQASSHQSRA